MTITIFAITGDPLPTAWTVPDWPALAAFIQTDEFHAVADRAATVTIRCMPDVEALAAVTPKRVTRRAYGPRVRFGRHGLA